MHFWSPDNIRAILGGLWLARPDPALPQPQGVSTDSRSTKPHSIFIALRGEHADGHDHVHAALARNASLAIVERDVPPPASPGPGILRVPDTAAALLRLAAAYRKSLESTRVIAVGGSNGKTTTVRLIESILASHLRGTASPKSFNNAVGVPTTILAAKRSDQYLICEVGTNAPGEIASLASVVQPDIAVITSIGREHLEGLGSLEGVLREEAALISSLRPGGLAIVHADSPLLLETVRPLAAAVGASILSFGLHEAADLRLTHLDQSPRGIRFTLNDRDRFLLPLLGTHNASNAAAAIAVARRLGVPHPRIDEALANAKGPAMRLEPTHAAGITFINDAYNANPDSMLAALHTFSSIALPNLASPDAHPPHARRVIILGDMLELGPASTQLHAEIAHAATSTLHSLIHPAAPPPLLLLVGSHWPTPATLPGLDIRSIPILDDPRALASARDALLPGDLVLLKGSRRMGLERLIPAWTAARQDLQPPTPIINPASTPAPT